MVLFKLAHSSSFFASGTSRQSSIAHDTSSLGQYPQVLRNLAQASEGASGSPSGEISVIMYIPDGNLFLPRSPRRRFCAPLEGPEGSVAEGAPVVSVPVSCPADAGGVAYRRGLRRRRLGFGAT